MGLVLGIDAAWTEAGSSGVALKRCTGGRRQVVAAAPSYAGFINRATDRTAINWVRPLGGAPDVSRLLKAATKLGGAPVDVVAIDMPMALTRIGARRVADNAISREFGSVGAGTHSVNEARPGSFGKSIVDAFRAKGFSLATTSHLAAKPALVEVFPLAALVRLMELDTRPPYKVTKTSKYWPSRTREERQNLLRRTWSSIFSALQTEISEIGFPFPTQWSSWAALKPYEDALDAVISAWAGSCLLDKSAEAFGDSSAAIWVPKVKRKADAGRE
jgi:predicted RNase H-like nuclease